MAREGLLGRSCWLLTEWLRHAQMPFLRALAQSETDRKVRLVLWARCWSLERKKSKYILVFLLRIA